MTYPYICAPPHTHDTRPLNLIEERLYAGRARNQPGRWSRAHTLEKGTDVDEVP